MSEKLKEGVYLEPGFVYRELTSEDVANLGNGPVITAGGFNDEELYQWLIRKVEAMTHLRKLHQDKAYLEERLVTVEKMIAVVTNESQLEISQTDKDPTPPQGGQGS